ncbi:MAG: type II toxin-antitoxin system RelE/ParE family toxin [Candidatus Babeliales bacterium]|jgi:phage-related protein
MIRKDQEYIIYIGPEFTVEWYFNDQGKSSALKYYDQLTLARRKQFMKLVKLMANQGEIQNTEKFNNEHDGIYAFKPKPDRFFCFFFTGSKIIITNAYEKKSDKMSLPDKAKAQRCYSDYEYRVKKGSYYE